MNVIVDPFTQAPHCGACGARAVDFLHAQECCAPEPEPAPWRSILAGGLVLASVVFLLVMLPLL